MSTSTDATAAPSGLRGLPRNVWVVTATSFLTDVSSEMLVHLLPLFLANVLGVRLSIVGLIEGVAETTATLLKVFSGWLSDRLGDRKWLTVAGYSLSTLAKPFLYVANTWGAVLAVRFADRVGKGIRTAGRAGGRQHRRQAPRAGLWPAPGRRHGRRADRAADRPGGGLRAARR